MWEWRAIASDKATPDVHSSDPTKPLKSMKEAWETAKKAAGIQCRFHDLRHSACTGLVERGVPLPVIASILGWSAGTTVRMARRCGQISGDAQREAVMALAEAPKKAKPVSPDDAQPPSALQGTTN
jgi:integrase